MARSRFNQVVIVCFCCLVLCSCTYSAGVFREENGVSIISNNCKTDAKITFSDNGSVESAEISMHSPSGGMANVITGIIKSITDVATTIF